MRLPSIFAVVLLLAASAAAPDASGGPSRERADAPHDASGPDHGVRAGGMSLDQAVAMVQRRYNARVVRAEESREGDDVVYRIRLLSEDGRVFTVRVNARTGQMD
jgi:uncharacterized membrane protein YkoI